MTVEKSRYWTAIVYPESVKDGWKADLENSGVRWACSPLHDKDLTDDGKQKKPHWHIIIQWGNTVSANAIKTLLEPICGEGVTIPIKCINPAGAFEYLTHKNNPKKYQYEEAVEEYNGFKVPTAQDKKGQEEVTTMKKILVIIQDNQITEFCDLFESGLLDDDQYELAMKRAYFINKYIESYRYKGSKKNDRA